MYKLTITAHVADEPGEVERTVLESLITHMLYLHKFVLVTFSYEEEDDEKSWDLTTGQPHAGTHPASHATDSAIASPCTRGRGRSQKSRF